MPKLHENENQNANADNTGNLKSLNLLGNIQMYSNQIHDNMININYSSFNQFYLYSYFGNNIININVAQLRNPRSIIINEISDRNSQSFINNFAGCFNNNNESKLIIDIIINDIFLLFLSYRRISKKYAKFF